MPAGSAPVGSSTEARTVANDVAAFISLADGEEYYAVAQVNSVWRYVAFKAGGSSSGFVGGGFVGGGGGGGGVTLPIAQSDVVSLPGDLAAKQGSDAELAALAGLSPGGLTLPYFSGAGSAGIAALSTYIRDNILNVASAAALLSAIGGVGAAALQVVGPRVTLSVGSVSLGSNDGGKVFDNATTSARVLTIPQRATIDFLEGTFFEVCRSNTGTFTVQGEIAGMIECPLSATPVDSVVVTPRYGSAQFRKRVQASDLWVVNGNVALS
jgi:hypothetical protein